MKQHFSSYLFILILSSVICSCTPSSENTTSETIETKIEQDSTTVSHESLSLNTVIENKLFSLPSPIQTAMLVKDVNALFNPELLNSLFSVDNYITEKQKALGLGVYGANISYLALYNENRKLIDYISTVESLADDLGISNSFSQDLLERFQQNLSNEDSVLVILSQAYRQGDGFLKENQRKDISMLILTGGFIETMYLATKLYEETNSDIFIQRIAEQKESISTIIEVMQLYEENNGYSPLITSLKELLIIYDQLTLEYVYIPSETDENAKITTIKSKSVISMDKSLKNALIEKIQEIRSTIIA